MDNYLAIAGDLHLERMQYGLAVRYKDNQTCIETIVQDVCTNPECRGLILTGDTFHKKSILPKYHILLREIRDRIVAAGKKVWAIDGNHDGSDASWLSTIHPDLNGNGQVIEQDGKRIAFFSYAPRQQLYEQIQKLPKPIDVLVLHGRLLELMSWASAQKEPDYDFSAKELRELGIKNCTVFMGDIHTYSDFHDPVADNWFVYSGSTEMTEISEGNITSERFGDSYDTRKRYIHYFPERTAGGNWEMVMLPNRPFRKQVIGTDEDIELAAAKVDQWVQANEGGILALHYPDTARAVLQDRLLQWRSHLLELFDVPLSQRISKPLQDMKEADILLIAEKELTPRQLEILKHVLDHDQFNGELKAILTQNGKNTHEATVTGP